MLYEVITIIFVSTIIIFEAASNLFFVYLDKLKRVVPEWLFGLVMILDIILLTALLFVITSYSIHYTKLYDQR